VDALAVATMKNRAVTDMFGGYAEARDPFILKTDFECFHAGMELILASTHAVLKD
jgi:hypothetical protein